MGFILLSLSFAALFWGFALWLFRNRNFPEKLNRKVPLLTRQRERRLQPLFQTRGDVLWFALWPFLLGALFFLLLIVKIMRK